uniref:Uncharacterized protein n=1 Tax=Chromera velia CCMP2878 TaxID=1169474 RepID=A0A0G4FD82_9ALVE|eukprot:Cvel_16469.t1-p1 / transcript=Cvel_16469.t1 / gene=Cvel_16469 / organism=Chromera_velia_CCMP2878 / gene_product=hypothetical protein / transcript_product=hypothetical protein / location=Cvel_scaffold1269:42102-43004(-) / protein_length=227 / sequence_SO=supercontig / SO=protein_coding / is_pseudo=false
MSRRYNQNFLSGMMTDSPPASESTSPTASEAATAAARIDESLQPARSCAPSLSAGAAAEYRKRWLDTLQSKAVDLVRESTSVKEFIAFCCFTPFDTGTLCYDVYETPLRMQVHRAILKTFEKEPFFQDWLWKAYQYVQYTDLGVTTTTLADFEFKAENMKAWRNRLQDGLGIPEEAVSLSLSLFLWKTAVVPHNLFDENPPQMPAYLEIPHPLTADVICALKSPFMI